MENFAGQGSKYQAMEEFSEEVEGLMEDLCQSGFDTVHDSTLEGLQRAGELADQFGMACLSGLLAGLAGEARAGRHRMDADRSRMARLYTDIMEYLYLWGQKTAYDRGFDYYCGAVPD